MPQFILKINLGNDAMCTHIHVARALKEISDRFNYSSEDYPKGKIFDVNGNAVGSWQVTGDKKQKPIIEVD